MARPGRRHLFAAAVLITGGAVTAFGPMHDHALGAFWAACGMAVLVVGWAAGRGRGN